MSAHTKSDDDDWDSDPEFQGEDSSGSSGSEVPCPDDDHAQILRLLISEGIEAALEMFCEAKDPNIDPEFKVKLIGLGSRVGDNVRKAIATHERHFGGQG